MPGFSKALRLLGNCAGDISYLSQAGSVVIFLMSPQLLNCSRVLLGKLSHMGTKVIQEKDYQRAQLWGLALPLVLNSAHSLGTSIPGGERASLHLSDQTGAGSPGPGPYDL